MGGSFWLLVMGLQMGGGGEPAAPVWRPTRVDRDCAPASAGVRDDDRRTRVDEAR